MKCSECYWCALNHTIPDEAVCCNEKSKNYNQPFSKQERETRGCPQGETRRDIDYRNMKTLDFALKYYM